MAKGPRYRKPFRRRKEGKTNYYRRLKLIKSKKLRLAIRASNNHVTVQIISSNVGGDKILASAHSKELITKYGWKANSGNVPAAYLTGYLLGLRAKKENINQAIFDLSDFYHRNRVLSACKGVIDTGMEIPYREEFFPESLEKRIKGSHIEDFAKKLKNEDPEKYEMAFSGYLKKNKINPLKLSQVFLDTIKTIENKI